MKMRRKDRIGEGGREREERKGREVGGRKRGRREEREKKEDIL